MFGTIKKIPNTITDMAKEFLWQNVQNATGSFQLLMLKYERNKMS